MLRSKLHNEAEVRQAAGGGCVFRFKGPIPWWAHILLPIGNTAGRMLKLIGGCFLFCPRSEFDGVGGFCEQYYAAEEVIFVKALKSRGRFVIPRVSVLTSNRKLRDMALRRALRELFRFVVRDPDAYRSREGLDLWYGSEARDQPAKSRGADGSQPIRPGDGRNVICGWHWALTLVILRHSKNTCALVRH
jgi:hypothetical protein